MRFGAVLGLIFVLAAAPVAHAQQGAPAAGQASAREAFRRGEAAYSAGNYEVAVREWQSAYASDPRPRIQFNLSQAYERMGQLENAIDALKRFVESGDPEDPTYSDANARLVALQQRLAATGVVVQGGTEGGSILVDDQDWGRTPRPDKIMVKPGNHTVLVRWPSGREFRNSVYVPAGQVVEIQVPSEAVVGPSPVAPAPTPLSANAPIAADAPRSHKKKILLYSIGSGLAAAGVGLIGYGTARFIRKGKCSDDGIYCDPDAESAAKTQGIVGVIGGGALLAGGATLLVVGALTHDDEQRARRSCGIGWASAACTFRF
jgi:hypothetical protein